MKDLKTVGVIGAGRLGLCLAVNLEKSGYAVIAVDTSDERITQIREKQVNSQEPGLNQALSKANNITAVTTRNIDLVLGCEIIVICVPTPSLEDGSFSLEYVVNVVEQLKSLSKPKEEIVLMIHSTIMPGHCTRLQKMLLDHNYDVVYSPAFIAQGTILKDQKFPDQVLIGSASQTATNKVKFLYEKLVENEPVYNIMELTEAEITKIALNCFLTTKIAFANAIGDLSKKMGCVPETILKAIGSDSRIGHKFLGYGYGFGGPCLPRDNKALQASAREFGYDLKLSQATIDSNRQHLDEQWLEFKSKHSKDQPVHFRDVSYKKDSDIIEESQKLLLAARAAHDGYDITIIDTQAVIERVRKEYDNLFTYQLKNE